MTEFIGPKPGWKDHVQGTVRYEIDLETWSNSERDKHTDLIEQGAWLTTAIANQLRLLDPGSDIAIHDVRFVGVADSASEDYVNRAEVNLRPEPEARS
jgi:hypothetical protein